MIAKSRKLRNYTIISISLFNRELTYTSDNKPVDWSRKWARIFVCVLGYLWAEPTRPEKRLFLGRGAEEASLLELELGHLLVTVHLDDERHHQDEEGGSSDPGGLARALQELLAHEYGVAGGLPPTRDDGRLTQPRDYAGTRVALLAPPIRERHSASSGLRRHWLRDRPKGN